MVYSLSPANAGIQADPNPQCQQSCWASSNFGGCGSLENLECLCGNEEAISPINDCEDATCSPEDRIRTCFPIPAGLQYTNIATGVNALGYRICANESGIATLPLDSNSTSGATNTSVGVPAPSPFTGQATTVSYGGVTWAVSVMGLLAMVMVL